MELVVCHFEKLSSQSQFEIENFFLAVMKKAEINESEFFIQIFLSVKYSQNCHVIQISKTKKEPYAIPNTHRPPKVLKKWELTPNPPPLEKLKFYFWYLFHYIT